MPDMRNDNLLLKFIRLITFVNLPIRKKFALFGIGVLFWFGIIAGVAVVSLVAINLKYNWVVNTAIPQDRMVQKITRNLQWIADDTAKLMKTQQSESAALIIKLSQRRLEEVHATLTELLHGIEGNVAEGTGAELDKLLPTSREDTRLWRIDYLTSLIDLMGHIDKASTRFFDRRLQEIKTEAEQGKVIELREQLLMMIGKVVQLSLDYSAELSDQLSSTSQKIKEIIRYTIFTVVAVMVVYLLLHLIFSVWITRSIARPISLIIRQIHSLGTGDIDLTQKIEINSNDEIGTLSAEFNELMESVYGMTMFKRVIEEDVTMEDVYSRLAEIFSSKLEVENFVIYEVKDNHREMEPVFPLVLSAKEQACSSDIRLDCNLCRAYKTGHSISSAAYPGVCKQFKEGSGLVHICVPMNTGGWVGGVVQFLFADEKHGGLDQHEIQTRIFKAETYINQSLSVIEAKRLMNTLRDSALRDSLTGLYNRRFLQDHAMHIVAGIQRREKTLGLIMCDLDYFKQVNDQYGHDAGDLVLKESAVLIAKNVRESDLVIRFGGEEFLILLVDIHPGEALQVAEKIRATFDETTFKIPSGSLKKTISLGISEFPDDSDGFWQTIKFADVALYRAKEEGRNRAMRFTPEMWNGEEF